MVASQAGGVVASQWVLGCGAREERGAGGSGGNQPTGPSVSEDGLQPGPSPWPWSAALKDRLARVSIKCSTEAGEEFPFLLRK